MRCPGDAELSLAFPHRAGGALTAHLETCARCAARWRRLEQTRELARQLPWRAPARAELEQTRTSLLAGLARRQAPAASGGKWTRQLRAGAAAAAIIAAAGSALAWRIGGGPARRATTVVSRNQVDARLAGERAPSAAEQAYVRGWSAFRAERWGDAIQAFDDAVRLAPDGSLAEDARYWRAAALDRARPSPEEAAPGR